jgi:hypothetical protein
MPRKQKVKGRGPPAKKKGGTSGVAKTTIVCALCENVILANRNVRRPVPEDFTDRMVIYSICANCKRSPMDHVRGGD